MKKLLLAVILAASLVASIAAPALASHQWDPDGSPVVAQVGG